MEAAVRLVLMHASTEIGFCFMLNGFDEKRRD